MCAMRTVEWSLGVDMPGLFLASVLQCEGEDAVSGLDDSFAVGGRAAGEAMQLQDPLRTTKRLGKSQTFTHCHCSF